MSIQGLKLQYLLMRGSFWLDTGLAGSKAGLLADAVTLGLHAKPL